MREDSEKRRARRPTWLESYTGKSKRERAVYHCKKVIIVDRRGSPDARGALHAPSAPEALRIARVRRV